MLNLQYPTDEASSVTAAEAESEHYPSSLPPSVRETERTKGVRYTNVLVFPSLSELYESQYASM